MPRPLRPDVPDGIHHVMNRGIDHGDVFFTDNDRVDFGERLADIHRKFGVTTLAYCLMDNHFHLVLRCPRGDLSAAMQTALSVYTRHVNDRLGRDGALFRGRFHSLLVTDDAYLQSVVRYVHRNPLDLAGVDLPEQYRWSSHRTYLGLRRRPAWLSTDEVLGAWNGDAASFDGFVGTTDMPVIGTPNRSDMLAMLVACELVVAECLDVDGRVGAQARAMAMAWAAARDADETAMMAVFGVDTLGALRVAVSRARRRLDVDVALRELQLRAASIIETRHELQLGSDPGCNQRAARAAS